MNMITKMQFDTLCFDVINATTLCANGNANFSCEKRKMTEFYLKRINFASSNEIFNPKCISNKCYAAYDEDELKRWREIAFSIEKNRINCVEYDIHV